MMTKNHALIVTDLGSLHNGLLALMTTIPQIDVVGEASSASAALQMVAQHRPDLVLLDTDLPGSRPCALLKQIKSNWPATRCIALAGDVQNQQECEASGADIALIKGFQPAQLIATIEGLLQVRQRARSEEASEHGQQGGALS
jgi:DNA-binding NarL/FixJ family response regulator